LTKILGGGVIAPIAGYFKQKLQNKRAETQQKHNVNMAVLQNRQRLAASEQTHNSDMEMKQLEVARPWMRWVVAGHVMVLLDVAVIKPEYADRVFKALDGVPTWLIGLYITIFGFYFAKNKLSDAGAAMASKWRSKDER
jgi:hypothetical protein